MSFITSCTVRICFFHFNHFDHHQLQWLILLALWQASLMSLFQLYMIYDFFWTICRESKMHQKLSKTWSFIMIQLWSDKTELTAFLHQKKMSDFLFSDCFCRQSRETSKHVMIHCIKHSETCKKLEVDRQMNLKKMMFFFEKLQKVTAW